MPNKANHNREHTALVKRLQVAICERYMPRCFEFNLQVMVGDEHRRWTRSAPNGASDIVACIDGRWVSLEAKTGAGKLTERQRTFRDAIIRAGGVYIVARDVDAAMRELERALHPRTAADTLAEDVDAMAKYLRPDVVRIRYTVGEDWHGDPAIHFRVLLSDAAAQRPCLLATTTVVETELREALDFTAMKLLDYYSYRSVAEQAALKCEEWE